MISFATAVHRCARDARVVVPRARARVRLFSTSGWFIPEISRPRPFVCSPPRLSPRAGRAAGDPVKREGSAEVSHAVRPRRARELPLPCLPRRSPRLLAWCVGPKQPYALGAILCARVACACLSRAKTFERSTDRKPVAKSRSAAPFERGSRSIKSNFFAFEHTRLTFTSLFSLFSMSRRLADETGAPPPAGPTHPREQRRREPRGRRLRHRPQLRRAGRGTRG